MKLYPLTYSQKNILNIEQVASNTVINNIAATLKIFEHIDVEVMKKAINNVIEQNDALRIKITEVEGQFFQYVDEYKYREIDYFDFSNNEKEMFTWDENKSKEHIKLLNSDLCYLAILKINENEFGIYAKLHHIICDAWSIVNLGNKIMETYHSLLNNTEIPISPSFLDTIEKEKEYEETKRFAMDDEYWKAKFEVVPEITSLKNKATKVSYNAKRKTFVIPNKLLNKMREYCELNKASIMSLYLAAFVMYVNRTQGLEQVIVGTPILNRSGKKEKDTLGLFISTGPMVANINNDSSFEEFIKELNKEWFEILKHQKYPYEKIIENIRANNKNFDKLYDIIISYQNAKFLKTDNDRQGRWHFSGQQMHSLYIHINDRDEENTLIIDYDYLTDLFYDKEIEFIHDHIMRLLWHSLDNPAKRISDIDMVSEKEKQKILYEFNSTSCDYEEKKCVHELIEEQVLKTPKEIACIFGEDKMTYKELNSRANAVANELRNKGVSRNTLVAVMVNRSIEMFIGILGVLKAGGAYLPIDNTYPEDRISYMLEDSSVNIVLSNKDAKISNIEYINLFDERFSNCDVENLININMPNDLIYTIYTSGSTGKPKGVMISHKAINNFILGMANIIDFSLGKKILCVTTICFDIFALESFVSLAKGLTIVIANEDEQHYPEKLSEIIIKNNIDMLQMTPSRMKLLLSDENSKKAIENLSEIMIGGEPFPKGLFSELKEITKAKIYNMYGPTETTVWSTVKEMNDKDVISIGKPIANTQIYILDNHLNILPIGVAGELYIGGDGLANGYHNRLELTDERFIDNPFGEGKIYKTGDLARWFAKGEIEHLGRTDFQVKIRGFRIELGEIENAIKSYDEIKEAVVIDRADASANKYLCAFYVSDREVNHSKLKTKLREKLPNYMVPTVFMRIDEIPMTPNGKVNRKALPEVVNYSDNTVFVEPRNEFEIQLCKIFEEVIEVDKVGIDDNFFDIGGDSLKAIMLISHIEKQLGIRLATAYIYQNPTIREIANNISTIENGISVKDVVLLKKSNTDKNIFMIHAGSGEANAYINIALGIEDYSCYGINFEQLNNNTPYNISIEEIAKKYIEKIKQVQPNSPYYLMGWCIGGTIAFEIARQLEQNGDEVKFLMLLNSISPQKWDNIMPISVEVEKEFIKTNISEDVYELIKEKETVEEIWTYITNNVKILNADINKVKDNISDIIAKGIPNYDNLDVKELIRYINILRVLHNARANYFPINKINTQIYFINALLGNVIDNHSKNKDIWEKYTNNPLECYSFEVDHFNLTTNPIALEIAKIVNDILKEK